MIQRRGYLSRPSLPSNVCRVRHTERVQGSGRRRARDAAQQAIWQHGQATQLLRWLARRVVQAAAGCHDVQQGHTSQTDCADELAWQQQHQRRERAHVRACAQRLIGVLHAQQGFSRALACRLTLRRRLCFCTAHCAIWAKPTSAKTPAGSACVAAANRIQPHAS